MSRSSKSGRRPGPAEEDARLKRTKSAAPPNAKELVIITGISGSGKGSALKALEDLG